MKKAKGPGRPKSPPDKIRRSIVPLRFSKEEKKRVQRAAKVRETTVADWIRYAIKRQIFAERRYFEKLKKSIDIQPTKDIT